MSEPRVKASIWVSMALRMGNANGQFGAVLRRGDADAGGILVVLRNRDGLSVLSQVRAADGRGGGHEPVLAVQRLDRRVNGSLDVAGLEC